MNPPSHSPSPKSQFNLNWLTQKISEVRKQMYDSNVELTKDIIYSCSAQLQELYKSLLLSDIEVGGGDSRHVESSLWNDAFRTPISILSRYREHEICNRMIDSGIEFYVALVQEVGKRLDMNGIGNILSRPSPTSRIQWRILPYQMNPDKMNHYCLIQNFMVHVGDLLRLVGPTKYDDAIGAYEIAAAVFPNNGHPWNQMALVTIVPDVLMEMDRLLTLIYYYVRAVCVAFPFLSAIQDLELLFFKIRNFTLAPGGSTSYYYDSFIHSFFVGIGCLDTVDLNTSAFCGIIENMVKHNVISPEQLMRMIIIDIWTLSREASVPLSSQRRFHNALDITTSLLNGVIRGILMSEEIEKQGGNTRIELVDSIYLAHLKLFLDWIRLNPFVLGHKTFVSKFDTVGFCILINRLFPLAFQFAKNTEYVTLNGIGLLPEEKTLLGFLPLTSAYEQLLIIVDNDNYDKVKAVRLMRIFDFVEFVARSHFKIMEYCALAREFRPVQFQVPVNKEQPESFITKLAPFIPGPLPRSLKTGRVNVALRSIIQGFSENKDLQKEQPEKMGYSVPPALSQLWDDQDQEPETEIIPFRDRVLSEFKSETIIAVTATPTLGLNFSDPFLSIWTPTPKEKEYLEVERPNEKTSEPDLEQRHSPFPITSEEMRNYWLMEI